LFEGIITVNDQLKVWAEQVLHCKKVIYLPNFTTENSTTQPETTLKGISGKRILCLANLRHQKNHFLLLEVAEKLKISHPEWTFHLVGKDFEDEYSRQIKSLIESKNLKNEVFLYGTRNDSMNIISQAEICVLTSDSEGLPVALLEYGLLKKAVVSTNVGEIPLIIKDGMNGMICQVNDADFFYKSLLKIIEDDRLRLTLGTALQQTITANHSQSAIMKQYLNWLAN
jgi:glycosyltransferase involved in cell wall biosynthesis